MREPQISFYLLTTKTGILKLINLVFVLVSVCTFFATISGWSFLMFVSSSIICGLFYLTFVLIVYVIDGHEIQKTPFEVMANGYLSIIFLAAAICCWSNYFFKSPGITTTGVFCFFSFILFAVDVYFSLVNAEIVSDITNFPIRNPFVRNTVVVAPAPDMANVGQAVYPTINVAEQGVNVPPNIGQGVNGTTPYFTPQYNPAFDDKNTIKHDDPAVMVPVDEKTH